MSTFCRRRPHKVPKCTEMVALKKETPDPQWSLPRATYLNMDLMPYIIWAVAMATLLAYPTECSRYRPVATCVFGSIAGGENGVPTKGEAVPVNWVPVGNA